MMSSIRSTLHDIRFPAVGSNCENHLIFRLSIQYRIFRLDESIECRKSAANHEHLIEFKDKEIKHSLMALMEQNYS